jgi:uncharacterized protein with von Willebrand factor type A (vWA) domain
MTTTDWSCRREARPGSNHAPDAERFASELVVRLRAQGSRVPPDATVAFVSALAEVGVTRRSGVYWAGRATLVLRAEDGAAYDKVFAAVFGGRPTAVGRSAEEADLPAASTSIGIDDPELLAASIRDGRSGHAEAELRWSDRERLRSRDFAECTPGELEEVVRLIGAIRLTTESRRTRRRRATDRRRGAIDLRATTRAALRTGGEVVRTRHSESLERPRRLVLLCDVSGSMEVYARALVRFAHAAVLGRGDADVFTLGTRCTRITRSLRTRDADAALADAGAVVADWSGGTRLGDGLRTFNDAWGDVARSAVVVVLSDGWDRGEPDLLAEQAARLQRTAHRFIWVNPLKASPGFAPTAQGMAAALPFVDELVEGHSLASLESLAEVIAR